MQPFARFSNSITTNQQTQLTARATAAYRECIVRAHKALQSFLETDYLPNAVTKIDFSNLANGQAWCAHRAARSATTELSAKQIHALELRKVARIRAAMEQVIVDMGFEDDFNAFTHFLRSDPRFYFTYKSHLMREHRDIAKRADAELPALFRVLPRLPYGVKMIPSYAEKSQTTA